jgi:hypothetical protein
MATMNRLAQAGALVAALLALPVATTELAAQDPPTSEVRSTTPIPIRQLTGLTATDSGVLRNIQGVRHLSDGRVLVNDPVSRRMLLLDATLKNVTVIADTAVGAANAYSTVVFGLVPYLGDTTLFVDRPSSAFILIEPDGKFGRVMSPPKVADLPYMGTGTPGFDSRGRIVYRGYRRPAPGSAQAMEMRITANDNRVRTSPDSAPILRADFDTRQVDTVAMLRVQVTRSGVQEVQSPTGARMMFSFPFFDPLPVTDEWTILPDGTIAIVRTRDYHIDWIDADGKVTSTPRMPFDWKRITLEDKQQIIDSVRSARAEWEMNNPPAPPPTATMDGRAMVMPRMAFRTVEPEDLPDYYPPVRAGQVKADPDGNVWVLPATSTAAGAGLVYDVVNRKGEIVERVQLPAGRNLLAIGAGGVVYMSPVAQTGVTASPAQPIAGGFRLERALIDRTQTAARQ